MSDPARPVPSFIDPLKDQLTCRNGGPHYCPNCDHAIAIDLQEVADRYKALTAENAALLAHRAQLREALDDVTATGYLFRDEYNRGTLATHTRQLFTERLDHAHNALMALNDAVLASGEKP